jgi:hypothetical protein
MAWHRIEGLPVWPVYVTAAVLRESEVVSVSS